MFLLDALSELTVLLKTFTSTLGVDQNVEVDANDIFKRALDPYLECCSDVGRNLTQKSRHIFLLNCLYAVQQHLQSNNAASSRLQDLAESIRSHVYTLVDIEHETFLDQSGIRSLIAVLGDHQPPVSGFYQA